MKDLIVVLEDEEDLLELLEYRLGLEGFEVIGCLKTLSAKKILLEENVSLMIVDRNLGNEEGSEFVKEIRKEGYRLPVIFLSAKDSQEDKLIGFERGGDDYITKPFDFNELLARIKAVIKRYRGLNDEEVHKYKNLILHSKAHFLEIHQNRIEITPLETKILLVFLKNVGLVLDRTYLLEEIWGSEGELKSVNVAIKRLRNKMDFKDEEQYIKTVRGEGYMFV
ncbi:response regulator transcription factor [Helicobacter sp. 13S00477-4]|uniref:response regulator transcription factor n=1 Tax=Helicobacter sp. 13S00477-4 TaxID=1905759 RepID=UPI000BA5E682|nr:response regulator transcription factor [Helicobacter sp. 13S00477-4]PAF52218.1 DNA-binding response regulator [Helicobacter sp. 13S00477-4]